MKEKEYECENTVLMHILKDNGKYTEGILPTPRVIGVHHDYTNDKYSIATEYNITNPEFQPGDKVLQFLLTITNDPSTLPTGELISLGYYGTRFHIKNGIIKSTNPLIIECDKLDYFLINAVTPLKYAKDYQFYKDYTFGFNIGQYINGVMNMHYIYYPNHSKHYHVVLSTFDKETKGVTSIHEINPMSYFQPVGMLEMKKYKTQKGQEKYHKQNVDALIQVKNGDI